MKSVRLLLCLSLLVPTLLRAQAGLELRTALVIGCDYVGTPHQLPSPARDARAMAEKLEQLGFAVTLKINPELDELERVSNEFSNSLKIRKGVGLFYYSGHGSQVDDRNYLIPHKAQLNYREDLRTRAYAAQDVVTRMEAAGNRLNLLFLDACRTNDLPSASSKSLGKGLAGMEAAAGMLIGFASARNTEAIDSGLGSVYTNALLAHIGTPGLSVLDMLTRVNAQVKRETAGKQIPFMEVGLDGTFVFAPNPAPLFQPSALTLRPSLFTSTSPFSGPALTTSLPPSGSSILTTNRHPFAESSLTPPSRLFPALTGSSSPATPAPSAGSPPVINSPFHFSSPSVDLNSLTSAMMAARLFSTPGPAAPPAPVPGAGAGASVPASQTSGSPYPWRAP